MPTAFEGKVALVTGAAGGIGLATAKAFGPGGCLRSGHRSQPKAVGGGARISGWRLRLQAVRRDAP